MEFWILTLLSEGPLHGYALMKRIALASGERVRPGPATLYRTLDRLEAEGWVHAEAPEAPEAGGRTRVPMSLTPEGRERLRGEVERLADLESRGRRALESRG